MSEYFVGTTGSNSQTTFEALSTSEVLDDLGLNITDSPTFSGVFLEGSGNTIFSVDGANGRLFGVTDEVTGTIFSVNDAAGLPILEVESTAGYDKITIGEYGSDLLVLSGQTSAQITGSQIATESWVNSLGFSSDTNYYLTGIEKSSNTLSFKVSGASDVDYTFGANAFNSTTIPSAANNATISISAGSGLSNGGSFTTDQSSNGTITIDHNEFSRTDTTSTASVAFGGTITGINTITSDNGHVTAENTVTYTLPTITSGDITGAFGADVVLYDSDGAIEATEFIGDVRGAISFKAQAAEAITKGAAVFISGISGNTTVVALADANDATKMPAFGIAGETAGANNPVTVINFGELANLDTDTPNWDEGDELFVSTTAGALTTTAPTSESSLLQKIAKVTKRHASTGSITVMGAGRTNAVPNLNEGRLFVGNSSNQAVADGTIHVDIANSKVGIGTTSPYGNLNINVGTSGVTTNISSQLAGSWSFGNLSAGSAAPTLIGKSNNNVGAIFLGATNDSNTAGDMHFNVRENDGTDFSTTSSIAFKFQRYATDLMTILRNGKVGIGTASPSSKLHVYDTSVPSSGDYITSKIYSSGQAAANGYTRTGLDVETLRTGWFNADATAGNFKIANNHRIGNSSLIGVKSLATLEVNNAYSSVASSGSLTAFYGQVTTTFTSGESPVSNAFGLRLAAPSIAASTSINNYYGIYIGGASTSGTITNKYAFATEAAAGNVGIGTTSPTDKLTINQPADNNGIRINGYDDHSASYLKMYVTSGGTSVITQSTNGTSGYLQLSAENYLQLVAGTYSYTTNPFRIYDGTQLQFGNSADFRINYSSSEDVLKIHSVTNNGITMDPSGNVGINNTSPQATLELKGSTADSSENAFVVRDSASAALFSIRNDGRIDATGNVVIGGTLTVNGTTTTINSTTISVDDKNIELGSVGTPTDTTADGGGITLKGATDKTINWVNSTSSWTSNQTFSAPNLTLTNIASSTETTALFINASNGVVKRTLGSAAFSATSDFLGATAKAADSELLDGIDSSAFLRSNTSDTFSSGTLTFANGTKLDLSTNDAYANMRVIRNESGGSDDGMYIGYGNANSGLTRIFGGGSTTVSLTVGSSSLTFNGGNVWHAGNDGSGSGLDADTVDGIQAASFLRSDANDSASGDLTFTGNITGSGSPQFAGFFMPQNPEGNHVKAPWFFNDMAYARLRGATVSVTVTGGSSPSNGDIDAMLDASTGFWNLATSGVTEVVITMSNLPKTMYHGSHMGVTFGNTTWRAKNVKLESYYNGQWNELVNLTDQTDEYVTASYNSSSNAQSQLRWTFSNFNTTSMRIVSLFAYNYNATGMPSLYLTKDGGEMYGDVDFGDSVKAKFGAGDDLQIYHDGSNSWISEVGTGSLITAADHFYLRNAAGNETKISATSNGSVELYYDNNKKFETTSSGITVTGSIVKSGGTSSQFLKADGSVDSNTYLTAHPTISAASSSDNSGRTYIQDILLDSNGHVTGITTATETVTDTNTFRTVTAGGNTLSSNETLAFTAGSNITITENAGAVTIAASIDGGNATTLDSLDSTSFLRSDADDETTGNLNIQSSDGSKSLRVGNVSSDNYVQLSQDTSSSTVRGFTNQHSNASVLENLQGSTNQHIVLGDVDNGNSNTLFGVSVTSGGTTYNKLTLSGAGDATFAGSVTATSLIKSGGTSSQFLKADGTVDSNSYSTTSHNHTLDSLSNVTVTSNTSGEILRWSGAAWINSTLSEAGIQASSTALTTSTTFGGDVSGTYNNIVVANDSHTHNANNLTGSALASGVTSSSLTSVGTITSGEWNGTVIDSDYIGGRLTKKISGDGTTTTFTVTHSFGTPRVMTQILDYGDNGTGATYEVINTTVKRNSDNAIDVVFGTAPTSSEDYLVLMTEMPAIS